MSYTTFKLSNCKLKLRLNKIVFEKGFVVLSLLLFTDGLISLLRRGGATKLDVAEGDLVLQLLFAVVYVITSMLITRRWRIAVRAIMKEKLLLAIVGIALASAIWSDVPTLTIRRGIAAIGTSLFGVYLATRYSLKEQLRLLAWTLGIATLLSLVFALALPSYGVHQADFFAGAWRGIYVHKNALGRMICLSILVFLLLSIWGEKSRWFAWAGFGLSAIILLKSTSATPLFSFLSVLALLPLYSVLQWRHPLALFIFTMGVTLTASITLLLTISAETILGAYGRDLTFTGRTELWFALIEWIQKRPWLGYGYSAFWLGKNGEVQNLSNAIGWTPAYAHNGYLQLLLDLGLLGTGVIVLGFLLSFSRALIWARSNPTAEGIFPLVYFTFLLPYNVTDSIILQQNNIFWVLYVSTTISMFVQLKPDKLASEPNH